MFRHRRHLRRWAARVLLLWLFGIGTGAANACLAANSQESGGHSSGHPTASQTIPRDGPGLPTEARPGSQQTHHAGALGPEEAPGKSNCQDFCEKSTISLPSLKSALDSAHGHALPVVALAMVIPVPVFSTGPLLLPRRDGGLAHQPITIAFLRLAL